MDKNKKYIGVIVFCILVVALAVGAYKLIVPQVNQLKELEDQVMQKQNRLTSLQKDLVVVQNKIKKIKDSIGASLKKIYSPTETDLGNETLFFTLYNDVIEMVRKNHVKIKSINYEYNPSNDEFVKFGKDVYFVCNINMDLVSNYANLGKLIESIYKYNYYIRINSLEIVPYSKDKKVLLSKLSVRLYAHTEPEQKPVDTPLPSDLGLNSNVQH